ncbi:uncharacterized protein LOC123012425 isoform X3 [Tribolium madens]|uniref:uncharacterized protein LOC123012425 isoform X3 n=1 Tax=Tribolium madens TaxID=41895 RepID=UPI001CF72D30|nr:uncharacterized protein LOC123012425 isoform X3 [Tribolium madens]
MDNYGLHFSTWFSIVWMCRRMSISRSQLLQGSTNNISNIGRPIKLDCCFVPKRNFGIRGKIGQINIG